MMKLRIASVALAASLLGGAVSVAAQEATPIVTGETVEETTTQAGDTIQQGGAAGLVAAVVQATDTIDIDDTEIEAVTVELEESLNNLEALNNVLNNSPILNENNIVITDVIEVEDVDAIVAIGILDGGDLIVFTNEDE